MIHPMVKLPKLFKSRRPRPRTWRFTQDDLPWFSRGDALGILERRRRDEKLADADFEMLRKWVVDGYFVHPAAVPEAHIDALACDVDALWTTSEPVHGLLMVDLRVDPDKDAVTIPHAELIAMPLEQRFAIRDRSYWRIHGFHFHKESAKAILNNAELARLASLIMGRRADPVFTINFMYGSRQSLHQDSGVFHIAPPHYLAGAWLACEDISPDSGPLVYCPGSHREPLFPGFDNYPQTNLRTMPKERMQEYYDYINKLAEKYEKRLFIAKKGEILFWHGLLIHGGSEVKRPDLTRRSYVCHYIPPGMDVSADIVGPFNW